MPACNFMSICSVKYEKAVILYIWFCLQIRPEGLRKRKSGIYIKNPQLIYIFFLASVISMNIDIHGSTDGTMSQNFRKSFIIKRIFYPHCREMMTECMNFNMWNIKTRQNFFKFSLNRAWFHTIRKSGHQITAIVLFPWLQNLTEDIRNGNGSSGGMGFWCADIKQGF